ncbi:MAG TPA: Lrp/AsnC ligand binding domain-containing protein [Nitrososphaerales archaeon]|nr:Lrp/AsnC ligand binding domain-containing protein [Nitrososphaerales archaeon]
MRPSMLSQVTKQLNNVQGITFFTPTTGRFDLAIELNAMAPNQVQDVVNKIRSLTGVTATRTYTPFEGSATSRSVQESDSLALVLLQVNEQAQKVLQSLKQNSHVRNAFAVSGEFDVLATVYGKNTDEIFSTVTKIGEIEGVRTSETLVAYRPTWA